MSQENVELLRRAWETVNRRDESGFDYLDPDIQIEVSSEIVPDAGTYRGHEGYRAMMRQWFEAWEDVRYEPTEFMDGGGDLVIVVANMHMRARKTGLEMDSVPWFFVYTVRDGRITRIRQVPDRAAAFRLVAEESG
jgi:ketosteroid isomerase-like protein